MLILATRIDGANSKRLGVSEMELNLWLEIGAGLERGKRAKQELGGTVKAVQRRGI